MTTTLTTHSIRVAGHLDNHWSSWLGELDITDNEDGTTSLTVSIADQAQLHGVLALTLRQATAGGRFRLVRPG
jgi:hypothetical protein